MQRNTNHYQSVRLCRRVPGFTLIEVILAVCIILLALVPLLHLHVKCIQTHDVARALSKATVLASNQLVNLTTDKELKTGSYQGSIDDDQHDIVYHWSAVVEDMPEHFLDPLAATGLRRVQLTLEWGGRNKNRKVALETLIRVEGRRKIIGTNEQRIGPPEDRKRQTEFFAGLDGNDKHSQKAWFYTN
jgi:hypothetical protein